MSGSPEEIITTEENPLIKPVIELVNFTKSLSVYELANIELELDDNRSIGKTVVVIDRSGNAELLGILSEYIPPISIISAQRSKVKYVMSDANGTQKDNSVDVSQDRHTHYYAATPIELTDNIQSSPNKIIIACWKYPDIERNKSLHYKKPEYLPKCRVIDSMYKVPNKDANKNIYIINAKPNGTYHVKVDGTEIPFVKDIKYCDSFSDAKELSTTDDFMKKTDLTQLLNGLKTLEKHQQDIRNIITESKRNKDNRILDISSQKKQIGDIILHYNRKLLLDSKFVEFTDVKTTDPPSPVQSSTDQSSPVQSSTDPPYGDPPSGDPPSGDPTYMKTIIEEIQKGTGQYYVWSDIIRKLKGEPERDNDENYVFKTDSKDGKPVKITVDNKKTVTPLYKLIIPKSLTEKDFKMMDGTFGITITSPRTIGSHIRDILPSMFTSNKRSKKGGKRKRRTLNKHKKRVSRRNHL